MDDLISRRALYKKTAEWEAQALQMVKKAKIDDDRSEFKKWSIILTERSAFKFDVADAPSAPQWIPCSERLPEYCKEVLAVTSIGGIYVAKYEAFDTEWHETVEYRRLLGVSAWMPLPEPYKEERKEDEI